MRASPKKALDGVHARRGPEGGGSTRSPRRRGFSTAVRRGARLGAAAPPAASLATSARAAPRSLASATLRGVPAERTRRDALPQNTTLATRWRRLAQASSQQRRARRPSVCWFALSVHSRRGVCQGARRQAQRSCAIACAAAPPSPLDNSASSRQGQLDRAGPEASLAVATVHRSATSPPPASSSPCRRRRTRRAHLAHPRPRSQNRLDARRRFGRSVPRRSYKRTQCIERSGSIARSTASYTGRCGNQATASG